MIYVLGHKIPDTDAITSAIVYANFLTLTGQKATPIRLGDINKETLFILNKADTGLPEMITQFSPKTTIALVDHNESAQSIDNIADYTLHSVIDHHKIGDLTTGYPIALRFEPLASTNAILYKLYQENNIEITPMIATLMLGGILSDTLHFRSPTTTDFEKLIVPTLAQIAQIDDVTSFAMEMFAAKSDLGDISAYQLIKEIDAKDFVFGNKKSLITCIETTNPDYCLSRQDEIINTIQTIKASEGYDFILFCVIDILQEKNTTIVASDTEADIIKRVFGSDTVDGLADLGDRISRKKTIVPPLEAGL